MNSYKKYIFLMILLLMTASALSQTEDILSFNYQNRQLSFNTILSNFQNLFPEAVLIEPSSPVHKIYSLEYGEFKIHFVNDTLAGLEIECMDCYDEKSTYNLLSNQLINLMDTILVWKNKEGNKSELLFYANNYLSNEIEYFGLESGDLLKSIFIVNINFIEPLSDLITLGALDAPSSLFEISGLVYSKGRKEDYNKIALVLEENALKNLEANPNDLSSYYNPYRILIEIYERTEQYDKLLNVWKKLESMYPDDATVKSNIEKYKKMINEKDTLKR